MIKYVKGDVTVPRGRTVDLIVQCVNASYKMGSGVALSILRKWPEVRHAYMEMPELILGEVHYVNVDYHIRVANMVGQQDVKSRENPVPVDYAAFRTGLGKISEWAAIIEKQNLIVNIHMPKIGCGLAGGDWKIVEMIVDETFKDFSVTVYDF